MSAHEQIKKLHLSHEELKSRVQSSQEEIVKLKNESESKSKNICNVEQDAKNKEIALLDKIKIIETKLNESNNNKQQLQRNIF